MDDKIKLIFELFGKEGLDSLRAKLTQTRDAGGDVAAALGRGEISAKEADVEFKRLAASAKNLEQAIKAIEKAGDPLEKTGKGVAQARQGFLDLSRAVQDFAQGGIGGILNNLEGLGRAIPALLANPAAILSSIPGLLTIAGTALFLFGGKAWDAFKGFAYGANEIPKATDALKRIDESLKEVTKQLDAYREKTALTNKELADYNRLSEEQVRLEDDKIKALERAENVKKLRALEALGADDARKQRKEAIGGVIGGRQAATEGALAESFSDEYRQKLFRERDTLEGQIAQSPNAINRGRLEGKLRQTNAQIQRALRGEFFKFFQGQAEQMIADAAAGNEKAIADVLGAMGRNARFAEGADLEIVRRGFEGATPAGLKASRDAAHFVEQQRHDAQFAKEQKEKAKAKQDAIDREAKEILDGEAGAEKAEDKDEGSALKAEAKVNEDAIDAEVKKIKDTVGKTYQQQYEMTVAENNARIATGQGGIDPRRLEAQLRGQMSKTLQRRGASEQGANLAARDFTQKGNEDLGRRAADASTSNLGIAEQTLAITNQLLSEYQRMSGIQKQLMAEAQNQRRRLQSAQRSGNANGRGRPG